MIVRVATHDDIPAIVEMSRKFYATTNFASLCPMEDAAAADLAAAGIATGTMLVAESDGVVVGMACALILPFVFNRAHKMAHEVVWWVEPSAQRAGAGRALFGALEARCRAEGAAGLEMIALATSPPQAGALYREAGYQHSQTSFVKEFC